jgi:hypothetical protein
MNTTFKVGDIVDAKSKWYQATESPIQEIGVRYIKVDGEFYSINELTLVKIPPYKDQFTPWKPGCLVTISAETITKQTKLESEARLIANKSIRKAVRRQK